MRSLAVVFLLFSLVGCATISVPTERLAELGRGAVPEPQRPEPLQPAITVEPTGFRFTFCRVEVTREVERPDGRTMVRTELASDQPLGLGLGSGLFLDAAGNLSWVPGGLGLDAENVRAVEGAFLPTRTVWSQVAAEPRALERTKYELVVTTPGLLGPQVTTVQLGLPTLSALGWKVTQKADGSAFQVPVSLIDFLLVPTEYTPTPTGVSILSSSFPRQQVDYVSDGDVLRSSDGLLRIERFSDHLRISYLGHVYLVFRGMDRGCIVDGKTGELFRWSEDEAGVTADRGWAFHIRSK